MRLMSVHPTDTAWHASMGVHHLRGEPNSFKQSLPRQCQTYFELDSSQRQLWNKSTRPVAPVRRLPNTSHTGRLACLVAL